MPLTSTHSTHSPTTNPTPTPALTSTHPGDSLGPAASVTGGDGGGGEQEEDGGATDAARGAQPTGDGDEVVRALEEEWASTHESVEDQVRRQFPTPEELAAGLGVSMQVEDAAAPGATPVAEP